MEPKRARQTHHQYWGSASHNAPAKMSGLFASLNPPSPFAPPSIIYLILTEPLKLVGRLCDLILSLLHSSPRSSSPPVRVVCISDTHCLQAPVPDGDLLIHAGDLARTGTPAELQAQIDWLASLPHQHKVVIAGNHDTFLDPRSRKTLSAVDQQGVLDWRDIHYLQHAALTLQFHSGQRQLNVYGAPQIPLCGGSDFAFQYPREHDAWSDTIPEDTDVLVTHTPPQYHLDLPAALGCKYLLAEVWRTRPRVHVFGHVHAGRSDLVGRLKSGREVVRWDQGQRCLERLVGRGNGFLFGVLDYRNWLDLAGIFVYGVSSVLWARVWGGRSEATIIVNAALMYMDSGELRNPPQVVEI